MLVSYRRALRRADRPAMVIAYVMIAIATAALICYLQQAARPWERGVEARLESGRNVKVAHHIITGLWYGSWINIGLCALLAIAIPFITRPLVAFEGKKAGISRPLVGNLCDRGGRGGGIGTGRLPAASRQEPLG